MRRWTWTCLVSIGSLVSPMSVEAQGELPDEVVRRPTHSLSLDVVGGMEIGYWTRLSERTDLGLEIGARGNWLDVEDDEQEQINVTVGPAIKRYLRSDGPLAPYAFGGLKGGYGKAEFSSAQGEQTTYTLAAQAGIGLDWFPARGVSVGGHVGLGSGYLSSHQEVNLGPGLEEELDSSGIFVQTFNSGLRVHLYF